MLINNSPMCHSIGQWPMRAQELHAEEVTCAMALRMRSSSGPGRCKCEEGEGEKRRKKKRDKPMLGPWAHI